MPLNRSCVFAVAIALAACAPRSAPENTGSVPSPAVAVPPADATLAPAPTEFVRANLLPCPWPAEAVAAIVGSAVAGVPAVHNAADSYTVHCSHAAADGRVLEVSQTWFPADAAAAAFTVLDEQIARQTRAIDNDADSARWVAAAPDVLRLVYTRANVRTEVTTRGIDDTPELRVALLGLPRLPAWQ